MKSISQSRITTAVLTMVASLLFLSTAIAFAPAPLPPAIHNAHSSRPFLTPPSQMSFDLDDVSNYYADFPLQAAVLTCGVKASIADCIAQVRALIVGDDDDYQYMGSLWDDIEGRRNLAYIIYGGIFIGAICHYEYDVLFPLMFGTQHSLLTSAKEVLFDNFITAPLVWLPPAYLIKALMYDYSLGEGLQKYVHDVTKEGLLNKYWTIWLPAQSVSFTMVPDHLRVVFMASISFFWFILFSTVSSKSGGVIDECQIED